MSSEPLLRVRGLRASLQLGDSVFPVVRGVSFDLVKGGILALVGESGCGKSMTALSLLKIANQPPALPPEGEVIFEGKNLLSLPEKELRRIRGGQIGMIFQDPSSALNPVYTVGDQLIEAAMLHHNIDEDEAYAKAEKVLRDVGIPAPSSRMEDYPHQLSGGMKQRVMIGMALLGEPSILIADEPTTALDVTVQAQVLDLLRDLKQKEQLAVLLITHDMGVVAELADHVAVMYAGKIVESGDVFQIFENPAHPYTKGLFESLQRKGTQRGELPTIRGSVPLLQQIPAGCPFHPRCPHAFEPCQSNSPPFFEVTPSPPHLARCWLHSHCRSLDEAL